MPYPSRWYSSPKASSLRGSVPWRAVLALLLAGAFAWLGWRGFLAGGTEYEALTPDTLAYGPPVESREPPPVDATESATVLPVEEEARTALPAPTALVLGGAVTSTADGGAVARATVTWTSWSDDFLSELEASVEISPAAIEARTVTAVTDELGVYRFDHVPPQSPDQVSVLWVTHPTYAARSRLLDPGEGEALGVVDFEMTPTDPVQVLVSDGEGPVEQAEILQMIAYPPGTLVAHHSGAKPPKDLLLFERRYTWHAGSSLLVAPLAQEGQEVQEGGQGDGEPPWVRAHKLWAESDGRLSEAYRGFDQSFIRITLRPAFLVSGVVLSPPPESISPELDWTEGEWGQARVVISAWQGPLRVELGSLAVRGDGDFGPQALPWVSSERYEATLVGNRYRRVPESFPPPQPSEEVRLHLKAQVGNVLWLRALDLQDNPIPFPWATARWSEGDQVQQRLFQGRADGYVSLSGVPDGIISGTISAKGYTAEAFLGLLSPPELFEAVLVPLTPVSAVKGRCMRGSEPVTDFEVRYWSLQDVEVRGSIAVRDSVDGRFELKHPLSEDMVLSALAEDYSASPKVIFSLADRKNEQEVVLSVRSPGVLSGRLVDSGTRTPLASGSVTLYATHSFSEMDPIGSAARTAQDGSFRIQRLPEGVTIAAFSAPGHSIRELKVWCDGETEVELGDIELDSVQPLRATVIPPEGQDPTRLILTARGIGAIPHTHFDAKGEILFPEASGGVFVFEVVDQDSAVFGLPLVTRQIWLRTGEDWDLHFDLGGGKDIIATISPGDLIPGLMASAGAVDERGAATAWPVSFDDSGRAELHGIPPGPIVVTVRSGFDGSTLGMEVVDVPPDLDGPLTVEVDLDRVPVTVRVVDSQGVPQQEVFVQINAGGGDGPSVVSGLTDGDGLCKLPPLPPEADTITLIGPEAGVNEQMPFALPSQSGEVVEVVFDRSASLRLHLTDEGVPQPTATVRLWNPERPERVLTPGRMPDAAGYLTLPRLGPGSYELRASASNLWPARMLVDATREGSLYEVSVRRLGAFNVSFVDPEGSPIAD